MSQPISRFPVPDLKNLPDDICQKILEVQEKAGLASMTDMRSNL